MLIASTNLPKEIIHPNRFNSSITHSSKFVINLFWAYLFYCTLMPSRFTPCITIFTIKIHSTNILLILITIITLIYIIVLYKPKLNRCKSNVTLIFLFGLLCIYAFLSISWGQLHTFNIPSMLFTIIVSFSACLLAYFIVSLFISNKELYNFIKTLVIFICIIGALYSVESYFPLGLRSADGIEILDFGIQRVKGPLFGSSTGHLILVPALSFAIGEYILPKHKITKHWNLIGFILVLTIISLGSRAGIVCMLISFSIIILFIKDIRKKILSIILIIFLLIFSLFWIDQYIDTSRFYQIEDISRLTTHQTSWHILTSSIPTSIAGHGYGSYWPWYLMDIEDGGARATGQYINWTNFGAVLYHPHSLLLLLIVELGIAGLSFFVYLWYILVKTFICAIKFQSFVPYVAGILGTNFALLFDFFIFKNWGLSLIWWIFVFAGISLVESNLRRMTPNKQGR